MGSVAAVIVRCCCCCSSSTTRSTTGVGGLRPVAMERTLRVIDNEARDSGIHLVIPCDARGDAP